MDPSLKVLKPVICHKPLDGELWSHIEVEKPKITSLVTLFALLELVKLRVELHADLIDLLNTTKFLELKKNLDPMQFSLASTSEILPTSLNDALDHFI